MANWTGVITNSGNAILSEWINSAVLSVDSAAAGQGTVDVAGMLAQTALVNQKQAASITGADKVNSGIRLKLRITAPQTAYTLYQFGVWASISDESTTMIALFQHEQGIPIPSIAESPDFSYTFYALISTSNTGEWTVNIDTSAIVSLGEMDAAIAEAVATKEGLLKDANTKNTISDTDSVAVIDSADSNTTKRVLWSTVKSALGQLFVPLTRKINNKALSSDVTLTAADVGARASSWTPTADQVGAVPTSRKINNKALSSDVTLTASDVGAVPTSRRINNKALSSDVTLSAADVNAVPTTRTVNGKALSSNVTLTGADINVSGSDSTPISTALSNKADVGAPQSYTLPLSTGWSAPGGARYQRTQDNMVVVTTGGIQLDSGASVSDGAQIATLPTGYRPRDYILVPAVIQDGGTRHAAAVQITISGAIIYNGPSNTTHLFRVFINASYFVN